MACAGLLGADVLGRFDFVFDMPSGHVDLSKEHVDFGGHLVELETLMGVPIVTVRVGSRHLRMFLDTGAQISYLETEALSTFPTAGTISDFYPGGRAVRDRHLRCRGVHWRRRLHAPLREAP